MLWAAFPFTSPTIIATIATTTATAAVEVITVTTMKTHSCKQFQMTLTTL